MQLRAKWTRFHDAVAKHRAAILILVSPTVFVFCLLWILENCLDPDSAKKLETCFQFLTGNWPATEGAIAHTGLVFAGGVTFKFALVYTALAALWRLWRDLVA